MREVFHDKKRAQPLRPWLRPRRPAFGARRQRVKLTRNAVYRNVLVVTPRRGGSRIVLRHRVSTARNESLEPTCRQVWAVLRVGLPRESVQGGGLNWANMEEGGGSGVVRLQLAASRRASKAPARSTTSTRQIPPRSTVIPGCRTRPYTSDAVMPGGGGAARSGLAFCPTSQRRR